MIKDLLPLGLIYTLLITITVTINLQHNLNKQQLATIEAKKVAVEYYDKYLLYEDMVISLNKDYEEEKKALLLKDNSDNDVKRIIKELERIW
jgi:hypothetical protein